MSTKAEAAPTVRGTLPGGLRDLLVACRPLQWPKNVLLYAAFIFSAGAAWSWRDPNTWGPLLLTTTVAFLLFTAIAAGGYLINDVVDVERDRMHPRKRLRPIAAGRLPVAVASTAGVGLVIGGILGSLAISVEFALVASGYAALSLAYSFWLKRLMIVDVVSIASGFTLRAVAGAAAIAVPVSPWLVVCTTLGALFVAVTKRRQELVLLAGRSTEHRRVLGEYTRGGLDGMSSVSAAATIVAYALYVVFAANLPRNHTMLLTLPFVVYGVFRYRLIAERSPEQNADELIACDVPLLASVVLFGVTSLAVLLAGG